MHFDFPQRRLHGFCVLRRFVFSRQILADIYRLCVRQNRGKWILGVYQRFQIRFCHIKITRVIFRVNNGHDLAADIADLIPRTAAITSGGVCPLRLLRRRVKGRLPLLRDVLHLSKGLAVGIHRRAVSCLAGERGPDFGDKLLQPVQQLLRRRPVISGELRKQVRVLDHPPREVRGDLVHHLVLCQRYAGPLCRVPVPLHDLRFRVRAVLPHAVFHRRLPEGPVLVGGQVLHPVGDLMSRHLIEGACAVRRDLDKVLVLDVLAVGLPAHDAVHELDAHAQLLADSVQRRCHALVFGDDVPAVRIVCQSCPRRGGTVLLTDNDDERLCPREYVPYQRQA